MTAANRKYAIGAGLALIVAPPLAILLKSVAYPGWMMFIVVLGGIPLLLGYALQIIVAGNGMLRARGVFNADPGARRGLLAAWLTSIGVVLVAFFLVDGGDDGVYGSAFTALIGTSSTPEGEQVSMGLALAAVAVWLGDWLWLVVEWVLLLARRRRASRGGAGPEAS